MSKVASIATMKSLRNLTEKSDRNVSNLFVTSKKN